MTDPSWGAQATGGSNMTPSVDTDGTIYIGTGDGSNGKLFAINPDGNKKWITFNDPTTGFGIKVTPPMPKCVVCHQHLMINMYTVVMGEAPVQ